MYDCLFAYVESIMFRLDAVLILGTILDIIPTKQPLF